MEITKDEQITYLITEDAANELLAMLSKLPWATANPVIIFIQQNLKQNIKTDEEQDKKSLAS